MRQKLSHGRHQNRRKNKKGHHQVPRRLYAMRELHNRLPKQRYTTLTRKNPATTRTSNSSKLGVILISARVKECLNGFSKYLSDAPGGQAYGSYITS